MAIPNIGVSASGYKVLYSNHIQSFDMGDIRLDIAQGLVLSFSIIQDKNINTSEVKTVLEDNEHLKVVFTNPSKIADLGLTEAMQIGTLEGENLYLRVRVSVYGNYTSYSVLCTFYTAPKSNKLEVDGNGQ